MASTLKTNAIEPEGATTNLVIGESGQNTVISNNDLRANVLQDAGGNALFTSDGSGNLSGVNSGFGSSMVLISSQTASGASSVSFTSGIDSTYGQYIFKFYNVNPATDQDQLHFNGSIDAGSNYNVTKTSTAFAANHDEDDDPAAMAYETSLDVAQGTGYQGITSAMANSADMCGNGVIHLFNPASTTYVKHYITESSDNAFNRIMHSFRQGYFNTTSAINAISFKTASGGNFDGIFKMWGVK